MSVPSNPLVVITQFNNSIFNQAATDQYLTSPKLQNLSSRCGSQLEADNDRLLTDMNRPSIISMNHSQIFTPPAEKRTYNTTIMKHLDSKKQSKMEKRQIMTQQSQNKPKHLVKLTQLSQNVDSLRKTSTQGFKFSNLDELEIVPLTGKYSSQTRRGGGQNLKQSLGQLQPLKNLKLQTAKLLN